MRVHEREPCFVCEQRERAEGQILCSICLAWARVTPKPKPKAPPEPRRRESPGRHGYPSQAHVSKATGAIAAIVRDAQLDGWRAAWVEAEKMVMQAESLEDLLRGIHAQARPPEPPAL